jgi:hypothetical protein
MRELTASFAYLFAAASIFLGAEANAVTPDDGLVHVIDAENSHPFEGLTVDDAPDRIATTVNLVTVYVDSRADLGSVAGTDGSDRGRPDPERVVQHGNNSHTI